MPTTRLRPQSPRRRCTTTTTSIIAGYVDKLNELIVDTPFAGQPLEDIILSADGPVYNNAAQAWNHEFFFEQLSPKPQKEPSGELLEAINRDFGSDRKSVV